MVTVSFIDSFFFFSLEFFNRSQNLGLPSWEPKIHAERNHQDGNPMLREKKEVQTPHHWYSFWTGIKHTNNQSLTW